MANPYFQFKQFTIRHDKCGMKVGTDGVLLGAWADVSQNTHHILDIGTGTGLVALMLAQRCEAEIVALEIEKEAAIQAKKNVEMSPWKERVSVVCEDFNSFVSERKFDVIVSNPPYFMDSLKSTDTQRSTARHTDELTYYNLVFKAANLLNIHGHFSLIIPTKVVEIIREIALVSHLYIVKQTDVLPTLKTLPKRSLLSLAFEQIDYEKEELVIELSRHIYSKEYINLTKNYYLKM
ncbi:MAG: methyltransferase [Bacteroides sp.]